MTPGDASGSAGLRRIAVVGGSIAGLTAAGLLRDTGFEVDVYERSPAPLSGLGTGIVVQPELVRYLLERTPTTIDEISVPSSAMRYIRAADGSVIGEIDVDWRFTSYNALYHGLLQQFGIERYHLAHNLIGLQHDDAQVELTFTGERSVRADLAVFADGGASVARRQLTGVGPSYAGYVTWRGVAELDDLPGETVRYFEDAFTYGLLDDGHLIAYPIPVVNPDGSTRRALNYQWYWNVAEGSDLDDLMTDRSGNRRPTSVHNPALRPELLGEFRRRAVDELCRPFTELLLAAHEPFVTTIADADVPHMRIGRCVLIGDAAITPRPHAAAGGRRRPRTHGPSSRP